MSDEREKLSYEEFGLAVRQLAQVVKNSGYQPDIVLSIARGGLIIGGALGYALGIRNTFTLSVEFYTGINERLAMPVVLSPVPNRIDLMGLRVLIADDVADTGATLKLVREFCGEFVAEVRSAVLYEKSHSIEKPDYVWKQTEKWIEFPWSVQSPVEKE